MNTSTPLFMGLDSSTQGLKTVVFAPDNKEIKSYNIQYDVDFPQYGLTNGVLKNGSVVTQPSVMYFEALDMLFQKMEADGFPFPNVRAISGAGQQHGSVYWKIGSREILRRRIQYGEGITQEDSLRTILDGCFAVPYSPIWMDNSTTEHCRYLEENIVDYLVGDEKEEYAPMRERGLGGKDQFDGANIFKRITGSRALERFTCAQILKIACPVPPHLSEAHSAGAHDTTTSSAYLECERISLISSALPTILLGDYAPIEYSDASGMNLLCIKKKRWSPSILNLMERFCPSLSSKLGPPASVLNTIGTIGTYFVKKYGFSPNTEIYPWMGDNPASLIGVLAYQVLPQCMSTAPSTTAAEPVSNKNGSHAKGTAASTPASPNVDQAVDNAISTIVSLGTSDTIFRMEHRPSPQLMANTFLHPLWNIAPFRKQPYINLICIRNGATTREYGCARFLDGNWDNLLSLGDIHHQPMNTFPFSILAVHDEINPPIPSGEYHFEIDLDSVSVYRILNDQTQDESEVDRTSSLDATSSVVPMDGMKVKQGQQELSMGTLLTSQFLMFRRYIPPHEEGKHGDLIVTGGASQNKILLQLLADVLGYDIYASPIPDSAALGGATVAFIAEQQRSIQVPRTLAAMDMELGTSSSNGEKTTTPVAVEDIRTLESMHPQLVTTATLEGTVLFSRLDIPIERAVTSVAQE